MNDETKTHIDLSRVKLLELSTTTMLSLLAREIKITNVPKDARTLAVNFDYYKDMWLVKLQSATFAPVQEGYEIPRFVAIAQKLEDDT